MPGGADVTRLGMTQPYGRIGVVVAEAGASSAHHADAVRRTGAELLVLRQRSNEIPETFARRCRDRLAEITRAGACIVEARLVGGGRGRGDKILARAALVRTLIAPMARQGHGKLVLAGDADDVLAMRGLAAVVRTQAAGTGVTILTDFDAPPSEAEASADDDAGEART